MKFNLNMDARKHRHEHRLIHAEVQMKQQNRACIRLSLFAIFCGFKETKHVNE